MAASSAGRPFDIQTIEIMYKSKMKPDEIIEHLLKWFKTFNRLINNDRLSDDTLSLLVHIIAQTSTCSGQLKRQDVINLLQKVSESELLNLAGSRLLVGVTCTNKDTHSFPCILADFVTILQELVLRMPTLCTTPQMIGLVDLLIEKISECDQLDAKATMRDDMLQIKKDMLSAVEERSKSLHTRRSKNREDGWIPPEYFKELSIMPSEQDLFFPVNFLRRNKSVGKYMDLDHYLDVQFRLYREDCISPLRDALSEFLVKQKENRRFRLENGLIYRDVQIVGQKTSLESGEVFEIKLDRVHCRRINWRKSKRLIYGSLLLLSFDCFRTISLAVVAESDRETLQREGCFSVQIFRSRNKEKLPKQTNGIMIEATSAYFEAYKHVLKALQAIDQTTFPFQRHLVYCEADINPPKYLTADSTYDLEPVITGCRIELQQTQNILKRTQNAKQKREIRLFDDSDWPTKKELRMDESQRQAFISALTKEFVLIQGPPGTGKTYLGLQIAKALLHNSCNWEDANTDTDVVNITRKPCMLVVCYSNHALDQFVEGIVDFMPQESNRRMYPNVVRFGSQCKNSKVAEFSIQNVKRKVRRHFPNPRFGVLETAMDIKKNIKEIRELLELIMNRNIVLSFSTIQCALDERHRNNFGNSNMNQAWLQWLHVSEQSWFKEVNKQYQNQDIGIEVQANIPVVNNEHELFVNVVSEAEFAFNERYFEVDDVKVKLQIESVGLDLEKQLDLQFKKTPRLEKKCLRILQAEKEKAEREMHHGQCMAEDNASGLTNLWKLNMEDRWKMYRYWLKKFINIQHEQLQNNEKRYIEIFEDYTRASRELDEAIMSNTTVIAMTTTCAARYNESLNKVGPTVAIVEEAAEVPEAHIVAAINHKCQHVILIGDHKQLEPKPAVYKLAKDFNLSVSLFERMLNNKLSYRCLQRQHRMRPEISALVRHIYPVLEDNENVCTYLPIQGVRRSLYFISHEKEETFNDEGRSYSNNYEAEYLKELCLYLTNQGYKQTEITIIAAYSGQMYCIREKMPKLTFGGVNICILDNYQGEENEIILISLVRSNKKGDIGFLNRENRVCVALSRAKQGLYIIGNRTTLTERSSHWNTVFETLDKVDKINTHDDNYSTFSFCGNALPLYCQNHPENDGILAKSPNDFLKAPEGGCELECDFRLDCGHACRLKCHPINKEHAKCNEVITETRSKCGHSFTRQCCDTHYERLNSCKNVIVDQRSKCNHEFERQCHDTMYEVRNNCKIVITMERSSCKHIYQRQCFDSTFEKRFLCKELLTEKWPLCDHSYQRQCFDKEFSSLLKCEVNVQKIFPVCDHEISLACHVNITTIKCKESISTQFSCGHSIAHKCYESGTIVCSSKCHKICKNCHLCNKTCHVPNPCNCEILVEVVLLNCKHTQNIPCSTDEKDFDCVETVTKIMPVCGHKQRMMCHMDPNDFKCMSSVLKPFPACEHKKIVACFAPINGFKCCKEVEIILDRCKHTAIVECWEKESENLTVECNTTISYIRPECEHIMDIKCFEKDSKKKFPPCKTLVNTHLKCGHISKRVCSKPAQKQTCEIKCEKSLLCGHPCPKLCQACQNDNRHGECRKSCDKELLCGHQCSSKICMNCSPCQKACSYSCSHTVCALDCCDPCKPCKKKCSWQCPHFKCTNYCDEICNRPRCREHCKKTLQCDHRCTGYCGEPCPDACIKCKPTIYILSDISKVDRTVTLFQCGHTFDCSFLDEYIHKRSSNILSRCPSCKIIIQYHPRYNVFLKRNKALLEESKQQILDRIQPRSKVVFPACIPSYAHDVERYSRSLATFLQIVRYIGNEADFLEIVHLAENLIKDIQSEIGNKGKDNFHHWLNISQKTFLMYIYWMVCLMSTKSDILSKTYVISNITTSTLQMVDNMNGSCPSSTQDNDTRSAYKMTGAKVLKMVIELAKELKNDELQAMLRPLVADIKADAHFSNAKRYPQLTHAIGVHSDDWTLCKKGHITSSVVDTSCRICNRNKDQDRNGFKIADEGGEMEKSICHSNQAPERRRRGRGEKGGKGRDHRERGGRGEVKSRNTESDQNKKTGGGDNNSRGGDRGRGGNSGRGGSRRRGGNRGRGGSRDRSGNRYGGDIRGGGGTRGGGDNRSGGDNRGGGDTRGGGDNRSRGGDDKGGCGDRGGGDNRGRGGDNRSRGGDSRDDGDNKGGGDNRSRGGDSRSHGGDNRSRGGDNRGGGDDWSRGGDNKGGGDNRGGGVNIDSGDNRSRGGDNKGGGDNRDSGDNRSRGGGNRSRGGDSKGGGDNKSRGGDNKGGGDDWSRGGDNKGGGDNRGGGDNIDSGDNRSRGGDNKGGGDNRGGCDNRDSGDNRSRGGGNRSRGGGNRSRGGDSKGGGDNKNRGGDNRSRGGGSKSGGDNKSRGGDNKGGGGDNRDSGGDNKGDGDKGHGSNRNRSSSRDRGDNREGGGDNWERGGERGRGGNRGRGSNRGRGGNRGRVYSRGHGNTGNRVGRRDEKNW